MGVTSRGALPREWLLAAASVPRAVPPAWGAHPLETRAQAGIVMPASFEDAQSGALLVLGGASPPMAHLCHVESCGREVAVTRLNAALWGEPRPAGIPPFPAGRSHTGWKPETPAGVLVV